MRQAKRVFHYAHDGRRTYRVDMHVRNFDGTRTRYREWGFRTMSEAEKAVDLKLGQRFLPPKDKTELLTVRDAWVLYEKGAASLGRPSSIGRFRHIDRHLGDLRVADLHLGMIDAFRSKRRGEPLLIMKRDSNGKLRTLPRVRDGNPRLPSECELDHEVKLLRSVISYAVKCKWAKCHPLLGIRLINPDNARTSVVSEPDFQRLMGAADPWLKPILALAYDTGMRRGEIANLTWDRVDLPGRKISLRAADTKAGRSRLICLTERATKALSELGSSTVGRVFGSLPSGAKRLRRGTGLRNGFDRAKKAAGLDHIWFHDLRRSFVTNARKRGVPESVVMRMSGHRTRGVFARYNIIDDADLRDAVKRIEAGQ